MKTCILGVLLMCQSLLPCEAAEQLSATAIASRATGAIELSVQVHSPLYAEVEHSPALSLRLTEALASKGFVIAQNQNTAKATLIFRGDIAIVGGPNYVKGVKVGIGDAVEKSLQSAKEAGGVTATEVVQTTAAVALNRATFEASISPFWRGLAIGNMASVLGEATGIKAQFNQAIAGDPRGICLSRCEDWNKVNQTVYLWISLQTSESKKEVRVITKAMSETVAPDQVLDRAMTDGMEVLKIGDSVNAAK